jgi:hypothetical protein
MLGFRRVQSLRKTKKNQFLKSAGVRENIRTEPAGSVLNWSAGSVFQPVRPGQLANRSNRPVPVLTGRFLKHWCFLNGEITFIYTKLDTSKVVSIGPWHNRADLNNSEYN